MASSGAWRHAGALAIDGAGGAGRSDRGSRSAPPSQGRARPGDRRVSPRSSRPRPRSVITTTLGRLAETLGRWFEARGWWALDLDQPGHADEARAAIARIDRAEQEGKSPQPSRTTTPSSHTLADALADLIPRDDRGPEPGGTFAFADRPGLPRRRRRRRPTA